MRSEYNIVSYSEGSVLNLGPEAAIWTTFYWSPQKNAGIVLHIRQILPPFTLLPNHSSIVIVLFDDRKPYSEVQ